MNIQRIKSVTTAVIILAGVVIAPASTTHALGGTSSVQNDSSKTTTDTPKTTDTTTTTLDGQQRLATIIAKGDQEITRRLASLTKVSAKIGSATRLSASDSAYLKSEVNTEIASLTVLKAKLDADTTLDSVKADAQSIVKDYRVYALIMPKIGLIQAADSIQLTDTKLLSLIPKLQTRITAAKAQHTAAMTDLQTKLDDMTTQVTNAQTIASSVASKVLTLQPTDYNSDHTVLSGQRDQLATAHRSNQAAIADAKAIVQSLKSL